MALLFGLICGILCGFALSLLVGFVALIPYLGWIDILAQPTFVIGSVVCGMYIGLKAVNWMGI